ncbi:glycoside hydrolase family 88 protein [Uliginosibacterium sp. H3]|uniref:Glycoside hydrolase family 88 protein n=1 Tax=Uliginosibacterium silvisoli TaxID=3114758 RepID=A0ABU6JZK7_9RHOO|nr:glycoside hydrolase family 88 protein [Uliginosibacterium sp. H3]
MKMCLPVLKKCLPVFLGASLLAATPVVHADDDDAVKVGKKVADYMMATWPKLDDPTCTTNCFSLNYATVPPGPSLKYWEYTNGVPMYGIWKMYEETGDIRYYNYVKSWIDGLVDADGKISYTFGGTATRDPRIQDTMQPATLLFGLYKKTGDARYLKAMQNMRAVFNTMQVNPQGAWWHKPTYPNQQWLDSTYMSLPFLAQYGALYANQTSPGDSTVALNMVTQQIKLMSQFTLNPTKSLYYHAWNGQADGVWGGLKTPPAVGDISSPVLWSRSIAWYYIGVIDVLDSLPKNHADRAALIQIVKNISSGLKKYQDKKTGLWNQVIDVTNDKLPANGGYRTEQVAALPNWNETSASALFVYGLSKAARKGYVNDDYRDIAKKGWKGVKTKILISGNAVTIKGTVVGMSVGGTYNSYVNADFRTDLTTGPVPAPAATCNPPAVPLYTSAPTECKFIYVRDNVPQGFGAVLIAAAEMAQSDD